MKRFKPLPLPADSLQYWQYRRCEALLQQHAVALQLGWNGECWFAGFDDWYLSSEFVPVRAPDGGLQLQAAALRIHGSFGQRLPASCLLSLNHQHDKALALRKLIVVLHVLNGLQQFGKGQALRLTLDGYCCCHTQTELARVCSDLLAALQLGQQHLHLLLQLACHPSGSGGRQLFAEFRAAGFRMGLDHFGAYPDDLARLWRFEPVFFNLAPALLHRALVFPAVSQKLGQLMPQLVAEGFVLGVDQIVCGRLLNLADEMGASLLSGSWLEVMADAAANPVPPGRAVRWQGEPRTAAVLTSRPG